MSNFIALLHASYIVKDVVVAEAFYCGILGLSKNTTRPNLPYGGSWLDIGDGQLHLLELDNPDPVMGRPEHGGRDRHVAMQVESIRTIEKALTASNIKFSFSQSGRKALFCRDPDGNALEFIEFNSPSEE